MQLNTIKHLKVWNCCFCLSKHFYSHTQTINWEPSCKVSFQISCLVNKSHFFMPEKSIPLLIHLAHDMTSSSNNGGTEPTETGQNKMNINPKINSVPLTNSGSSVLCCWAEVFRTLEWDFKCCSRRDLSAKL